MKIFPLEHHRKNPPNQKHQYKYFYIFCGPSTEILMIRSGPVTRYGWQESDKIYVVKATSKNEIPKIKELLKNKFRVELGQFLLEDPDIYRRI